MDFWDRVKQTFLVNHRFKAYFVFFSSIVIVIFFIYMICSCFPKSVPDPLKESYTKKMDDAVKHLKEKIHNEET